ncbi:MAG: RNA-binding protein [Sandaracinaceae bacterium]|nr:RNA-binding protein [Sandaracinaceae bacterium]
MANKGLFASTIGRLLPKTDTVNHEGSKAYAFTPEHALAQYAATGCLNHAFYATAQTQLATVLELASKVEPDFLAKTAVYAREKGHMKDMPALLVAVLSVRAPKLFAQVFDRVIDDGKMLRNFVQIMRSGAVGRKSLGTRPKKQVLAWLDRKTDDQVFRASIGQSPSLADVVKMVHPKPATDSRRALYAWLLGKPYDAGQLPELVTRFEQYKADKGGELPDVPFQMLTALELGTAEWAQIARQASWQSLRMNLNTLARHGVFEVDGMAELVAARLRDPKAIAKARVFPYQLMVAYQQTAQQAGGVPNVVRDALQDAMEHAIKNVPAIDGHVWVCPDVSGSMRSPVTGHRKGATSAVRCVDVAALFTAAILRQNPRAQVLPFEQAVVPIELNARDSVMTNAMKLASIGGGGTNVSAPLRLLVERKARVDAVVIVSDNESWVDAREGGRGTATIAEWNKLLARNPRAKLVCIDVQPYAHTQALDREDILNVGGFSDQVFDVVAAFTQGRDAQAWVDTIRAVTL